MRRFLAVSFAFAALSASRAALAYCPCYSPSSSFNQYNCGVDPVDGQNPNNASWNMIFDLVSQGPAVWGNAGPSVGDIGQGCGKPEATHSVPARFPCELLKGIAMQESGWRQFCVPDTPSDEVGGNSRTIISFDCGYGVGQVTSGMHKGENPAFDRARVAGDATYNLAAGTQILADKWKATNCVGDNQPTIIEDWYTAAWAYNGLAYVNNPNNPNYDSGRGVWDPQVGGGAPYQEKIFGWIENNGGKWTSTALAYPDPAQIGGATNPPDLDEPSCASPTDCKNKRSTHKTACGGTTSGAGGGGGAGGESGAGGSTASSGAVVGSASSGVHASVGATSGCGVGEQETGGVSGSCGCRAGGGSDAPAAGILLFLLGCLGLRRRRTG